MIYESGNDIVNKANQYTEEFAATTGADIEEGYTLMDQFLG